MNILCIGGNHPRHLHYFNRIQAQHQICGAVIELRNNLMPATPLGIGQLDEANYVRHFQNRESAEMKYFGTPMLLDCPTIQISKEELNQESTAEFVKALEPDVALIFGCGLIKEPLRSALPIHSINLHLGLSPRYRGAATLFWPFYFIEPSYAGSTLHYIVDEPDAGDIIHQVLPRLNTEDGIHDVACKTVVESAEQMIGVLDILKRRGYWNTYKQKSSGKNFLSKDFRPAHLRVIYNLFDDDMVKQYLNGNLNCQAPRLISQFAPGAIDNQSEAYRERTK